MELRATVGGLRVITEEMSVSNYPDNITQNDIDRTMTGGLSDAAINRLDEIKAQKEVLEQIRNIIPDELIGIEHDFGLEEISARVDDAISDCVTCERDIKIWDEVFGGLL